MTCMYRLKLAFVLPHHPMTKLMRVVDVSANTTLSELHDSLSKMLSAHVLSYDFYLTKQKLPTPNADRLALLPNRVDDRHKALADILANKDYFYYRLSVNDLMNHDALIRLRVEKIFEIHQTHTDRQYLFDVIDEVGELPVLFAQFDEHMTVLSSLILIATGNPPVRFGELIDSQIADTLLHHELIKPCLNRNHIVRLTPKGESMLAHFVDNLPKHSL